MSVHAEFFKGHHLTGSVFTHTQNNSHRYFWVKFGKHFRNQISSMRAHAFNGSGANVYGMSESNFLGKFVSLNVKNNNTNSWNFVGDAIDNDIKSALLIRRSANEVTIELKKQIIPDFIKGFDKRAKGTKLSRIGEPKVFATFFPSYDPHKSFVSIEQHLNVQLDNWPDYNALVRYDIWIHLNEFNNIRGHVAKTYVWVEGGAFTHQVFKAISPPLADAWLDITDQVKEKLEPFDNVVFKDVYLLPGPAPKGRIGDTGDTKSNCTLVLVL